MDFDKETDEVIDNIDNEKPESEEISFATDFSDIDSIKSQSEEIENKEEIKQESIDSPVIEVASMDSLVSENIEADKEEISLNEISKTINNTEENTIPTSSEIIDNAPKTNPKPDSRFSKKPDDENKGEDSGDPDIKKRKLILLITIIVGVILISGAIVAVILLNSGTPPEPTETPGETYTVTYTAGDAYTIVPLSENAVEPGADYSFRVTVNDGFAGDYMIVRAGGVIIEPENGIYTLTGVNSDITITVEGVMYIALESEFTYADNYIGGVLNGKKITGTSVTRTAVMLPSSVGGVPITGIGNSAFVNNSTIITLAIPDSIIVIGEYAFFGTTRLGRVYIPESLTTIEAYAFASSELLSEVIYPENPELSEIGESAFQNCDSMSNAIIPESVTLLGNSVFSHSDGLITLTLNNPVIEDTEYLFSECEELLSVTIEGTALTLPYGIFSGCSALQTVIIESGVTSINDYALALTGIASLTLPDTIDSIGAFAFSECSSLITISFNEGLLTIGNSAFINCISLETLNFPSTLISIGSLSFALCDNLTNINFIFSGALTTIGNAAFAGKQNISGSLTGNGNKIIGVALPATVTSLGDYAFSYCGDMTIASIPGNVGSIGQYVFYNCDSLSDVTLGQGITEIGNYAFAGTTALVGITLPTTLITLSDRAFYDSGLTSVSIPQSVTSIGVYCFSASALTSVGFEDNSALSIGNYAFYNCASLSAVTLPSALTSLGNYSFGSTGLTSITIPASVTSIGNNAFNSCRSLTTATIQNGVTSIGAGAFDSCSVLRLINIPASVTSIGRNAFRSTRWILTESTSYVVDSDGEKYIVVNGMLIHHRASSIKEFILPSGITSVNDYAFEDEDDVTEIAIPVSVVSIGTYAFYDCPKLRVVYMQPVAPPSLGASAFNSALRFFIVQDEYVDAFTLNNTVSGWTAAYKAKVYSDALTEENGFWTDGTTLEGYTGEETDVVVPYGITVIAEGAFRDNQDITSVTLPESLIEIEDYAFYNCTNLVTVSAPASLERIGNYAFALCTSLEEFNIASGSALEYIGEYAFAGTHYEEETLIGSGNLLSSFIIPSATAHIGDGAFMGAGLNSVIIPGTVTELGIGVFEDNQSLISVAVSDGISTIPDSTFSGCTLLTGLILSNGINTIGASAFYGCIALTAFTAPSSLGTIGDSAFEDCSALGTLILNAGLDAIGESAFRDCETLAALVLPNGLITLGDNAFYGCTSILSATLGQSLFAVPDYAFYGCSSLDTVSIPEGIAYIGDYAFYNCAAITSIAIPDALYIGEYAFRGADNLSEVEFTEGIIEILEGAFYDCDGIEAISLPDSLENIDNYAFYDCDNLYELSISEDSDLERIGDYAFHGASRLMGANFAYKLSYIGDYAFALCNELESITFDSGSVLSYIGDYAFAGEYFVEIEEGQWEKLGSGNQLVSFTLPSFVTSVGDYTFFSCKHLETIELLGNLSSIGDYAFGGCSLLTDFDIPEYLTSIGVEAFADCDRLTSLTLGSTDINAEPLTIGTRAFKGSGGVINVRFERNVQSIGVEAFSDLESLIAFEVSSNNMYFKAVDGVLFNVTGTKLIQYPASKPSAEYEIPSSINAIPASLQEIGAYAFINVYRLTSITFASGGAIQTIREGAFNGCISLASIEIPSSVTVIEKGAFGNCGSLTYIRMYSETPPELKSKNDSYDEEEEAIEVFDNTPLNAIFVSNPTAYANYNNALEASGWTTELKAMLYLVTMLINGFLIQDTTLINYVGEGGEIVIPSEITAIADNVFRNKNVTAVSGGENVETIGAGAFYGTEWLDTLVETAVIGSVLIKHSDTDEAVIGEGITEIYEGAFQNMTNLISITLPSSLLKIGNSAFFGCLGLKTITIPPNVEEIGQFAFMNCSRLTGVYALPLTPPELGAYAFDWSPVQAIYVDSANEVYYFYINDVWDYYSNIIYRNSVIEGSGFAILGSSLVHYTGAGGDITIPSSVVSIDAYAFTMNSDITSVTIPSSVNSIGAYAFKGAERLGNITFLGSSAPAQVGADIYLNTILTALFVPDGTISTYTAINAQGWNDALIRESGDISDGFLIEDNVLINYSGSASTVTVPVGVQTIAPYAFGGRSDISVINLPENVGTISEYAFDLCYGLTAINVAASNMSFSSDASGVLYNRSKTELVKYPAGKPDATYSLNAAVITVSDRAFYNADNLTSITLAGDVDTLGQYAFYDCDELTSITLGDSVSVLDSYCFASLDKLTNVNFGGGIGEIRSRAFDGCVSLTYIELPESLTFIGAYAFNNNKSLTTVITASALNNIGEYAFFNCVNLNTVTLTAINAPILGTNAFKYNKSGAGYMIMPSLAIYVPDERVEAYQTASGWSEYEAYIVAVSAAVI